MERCETCGSVVGPLPGDIVEVLPAFSGDARVGLAVVLPEERITSGTGWRRVVLISGARKGIILGVPPKSDLLRVVHGYIHIHRNPAIGTWIGDGDPDNYHY